MTRDRSVRWSFRAKLAMTIAAAFIGAGVCLMIAQYLLVSGLIDQAVVNSTTRAIQAVACEPTDGSTAPDDLTAATTSCTLQAPAMTVSSASEAGVAAPPDSTVAGMATGPSDFVISVQGNSQAQAAGAVGLWYETQSSELANDVLTRLLVLSGVLLVVFAIAAAGVAWWLARRSLKRIGEVTTMAKEVTTLDLHRRLDLPGPRDEIKELADTIDAMLDRLESAFAAQDRFVANASHELRTPLTTARTALEIPLAQGRVPADLQPAVRTALRAGELSDRLIDSLLTISRGQQVSDDEPVDVAEIVEDVVAAARDRIGAEQLTIELTTATAVAAVDPTMVEQAVANLLDNAIRHNQPGGHIRLSVRHRDGCEVIVENTGAVVDPDAVALLTEPFYRAEDSRLATRNSPGGTGVGLGLSIVASITLAHRGQLQISPRERGGLRVRWWLPA